MSKQEKPFIAKEDILTYKLLLKNERGEYFTPYFGKEVKLGETLYGGDIDVEYNSESNRLYNEIGSGYVHSYVNPFGEWNTGYEIIWLYDFRFDFRDCTCVLVKCIIPKGTEYYIDADMECIASKELVIGEKEEEDFDSKVSTNLGKLGKLTYEYSTSTLEDEYEEKKKGVYLSYLKDRYEALSNEEKETIGRIVIEDNYGNIIKEINPFEFMSSTIEEDKELIKGIIEEGELKLRIGITYNTNKDYVYIPYKAQGYGINPFEMEEDVVEFLNVNLGKDKVSKPTLDDLTEMVKVVDILNCIILLYCLKDTRLFITSKLYSLSDDDAYTYTRLYNLQRMANIEVVSSTYIFIKKN